MLLERFAFAVGLILIGYLGYRLYGWFVMRRLTRAELGLDGYSLGKPAILYFTDPGCAPCHTIQDPALEQISAQYGEQLQIIKVQALERPDLANSWGVLSLPTTFIIDVKGHPRGVNHGATRASRLIDQLDAIGATSPLRPEPSTIDTLS
jgi:thioredoxin-like negative regulator of GroEL